MVVEEQPARATEGSSTGRPICVLMTGPALEGAGGVESYYRAVLPLLKQSDDFDMHYLDVGRVAGSKRSFHRVGDQVRLRQQLKALKPDLLHVNPCLNVKGFLRDGLFVWQAKRLGIPVIVFFRGWELGLERRIEGGLWRWIFRNTFAKADYTLVLAKRFKDCLRRWGVTNPVELSTTAVDASLLEGVSMPDPVVRFDGPPWRLLFLSRLELTKGVLETIRATIRLRESGLDVRLTIAGEGAAEGDVRRLVAEYPEHSAYIDLVGFKHGIEKRDMFLSHHVFCLPTSHGEGMPNAVLEAMAFGLPVFTTHAGGLADFFDGERMGATVEAGDVEALTEALQKMFEDRVRMVAVSGYNQQYAQSLYTSMRRTATRCDMNRDWAYC